jgi:hypothetical protein
MIKTIGSIPVKTRVPLAAWAFAALLAVLSTISSFVQFAAVGPARDLLASASQPAREIRHASLNW